MRGVNLTQTIGIHSHYQDRPTKSDLQKNQMEQEAEIVDKGR